MNYQKLKYKEKMKEWSNLLENYTKEEQKKILKFENFKNLNQFVQLYINKEKEYPQNDLLKEIIFYENIKKEINEIFLMPKPDIYRYLLKKLSKKLPNYQIIKIADKIIEEI